MMIKERNFPEGFVTDGLSAVDARKIEFFYEQFVIKHYDQYGDGHFILACYAALPAVLTPDMLYKLWLNFKNYTVNGQPAVINPIAPADIMLSSLVEEIGIELFEMAEPVRKALLLYLKTITATPEKNALGLFPLDAIARFLNDYINFDFNPANDEQKAFREAQEWTVMSYLNPGQAFENVAMAFGNAQKAGSRAEQARYK